VKTSIDVMTDAEIKDFNSEKIRRAQMSSQ